MNENTVPSEGINTRSKLPVKRHSTRHIVEYSPAIADRICTLLTEGKTLTEILRRKSFPSRNTFYRWLDSGNYPDLKRNYLIARANRAHLLVEQAEIAPDKALDEVRSMEKTDKRTNAIVQAYRLKADTNLKIASLYNREDYGDAPFIASPSQIGVQVVFGQCVSPKDTDLKEVKVLPDKEVTIINSPSRETSGGDNE